MRRLTPKILLAFAIAFGSSVAFADLPVALVDEARLPYSLSPSNYDNSPSNYDNSISNYDNSPSNYENSESNYANSASNYDNRKDGKRRLILREDGSLRFAGYYVTAKNGTTNFYSPSGERMFYNPKKGNAVFSSKDGAFCGVLARVDGKLSLALTDRGAKILLLSD